jgi:hypothetical protein
MDEVFDTSWLEKYENREKELINHSSFEKEVIHNIKINILYINIHNNIEKINILNQPVQNNILDKLTLLNIIKSNTKETFKILSIAKYNNTLDKHDLHSYINETLEDTFLESVISLEDIIFQPGLCIFSNIHSLYFLFKERPHALHQTKHLRLTHNKTKRKTT